ncbi:MAG TPA: lysylphosphatidylglycerol synthase transmembrane domain-containing protein [Anaerolineales bacterium]|nr:lysylphosphatidylglycerol synthase transmembrane domain-containing protein [Anaerolineales bacterium]
MRISKGRILFFLVATILILWVVRRMDWTEVRQVLAGITPLQIGILLVLNVLIFLMFALRWWVFIRGSGGNIRFGSLARIRLTSFGITYFTPGPQIGGEPYQVYALSKNSGLPLDIAASSVSADKLTDLVANFSFLVVSLGILIAGGYLPRGIDLAVLPLAVIFLSIPLVYLALVRLGHKPVSAITSWVLSRIRTRGSLARISTGWRLRFERWLRLQPHPDGSAGRVLPELKDVEGNLHDLMREKPKVFFIGMGLAGVTWIFLIGEYHLAMGYLGLPLTWIQTIVLLTAARLAFLLPSPSGLGTLEAGQVIAMQVLGFSPAAGIGISLLIRARDVLFGGMGLLLAGKISR